MQRKIDFSAQNKMFKLSTVHRTLHQSLALVPNADFTQFCKNRMATVLKHILQYNVTPMMDITDKRVLLARLPPNAFGRFQLFGPRFCGPFFEDSNGVSISCNVHD